MESIKDYKNFSVIELTNEEGGRFLTHALTEDVSWTVRRYSNLDLHGDGRDFFEMFDLGNGVFYHLSPSYHLYNKHRKIPCGVTVTKRHQIYIVHP